MDIVIELKSNMLYCQFPLDDIGLDDGLRWCGVCDFFFFLKNFDRKKVINFLGNYWFSKEIFICSYLTLCCTSYIMYLLTLSTYYLCKL